MVISPEVRTVLYRPYTRRMPRPVGRGILSSCSGLICSVLTDAFSQQLKRYRADFEQGGMHGPLSYYRNTLSRYDDELQLLKRGEASPSHHYLQVS